MNTEETLKVKRHHRFWLGAVMCRFYLDERVYSLRHKKYGTIKSVDGDKGYVKGYVIAFSKDKYDYEYHYPNEVSQNGL